MRPRVPHRVGQKGQSMTETILLLPLYFLFVFGLLQAGQLSVALLVANYGASSIARRMVADDADSPDKYRPRFENLLVAGMKYEGLKASHEPDSGGGSGLLSSVTVDACSKVGAFPFVAQTLHAIPAVNSRLAGGGGCDVKNGQPFFFNGTQFIVHGRATARRNYNP